MKLTLEQIRAVTLGAARVEEVDGGIRFCRFTKAQEDLYDSYSQDFLKKTFSTAGICLRFRTDSTRLGLKVTVRSGSSRTYFAFDLLVNGVLTDSLANFGELTGDYTLVQLPHGDWEKEFSLGSGEKEVSLYFPWSAAVLLRELTVEDGAQLTPVVPGKKLLAFGDSITHGYDALHPSGKYISRLARYLDAQEFNKAIGGEVFYPPLALERESFTPDLITVAYGTNDWRMKTARELEEDCRGFYTNLRNTYPDTPIWAITPIWRADYLENISPAGDFALVEEIIRRVTSALENVTVIRGMDILPRDTGLFADGFLHPNDTGFEAYFVGLRDNLPK